MRLDRAWIAAHIPHQGAMCLLDSVSEWSTQHIRCLASSHRDPHNPLRARGRLGVACGIEYAAQSMAIHGALLTSRQRTPFDKPGAGYLAGMRDIEWYVARLDDVADELLCEARRVAGDAASAMYEFDVHGGARRLLRGRATVVLDVDKRMNP